MIISEVNRKSKEELLRKSQNGVKNTSLEDLGQEMFNQSRNSVHICLNILILQDNKAFAANIGGNRLFFVQRTKYKKFFESKYLTAHHTRKNVIEMYRVKREQSGEADNRKLATMGDLTDTRFILPNFDVTRAIGAYKIKGISSEPDIKIQKMEFKHLAIFFGSMGLWKVLQTQKIVNEF